MRRVQNLVASQTARRSATAIVPQQRHGTLIEPLALWWASSWVFTLSMSMCFWFPSMVSETFCPSCAFGKVPHIHFINERKAEFKLRSQLDDIYTVWSNELDAGRIEEAISRTF